MRSFAVFGAADAAGAPGDFPVVEIDGMSVRSGILQAAEPVFAPGDPTQARSVLVRVNAFSCNYRDKGLLLLLQRFPSSRFFPIGSEFAATVVEVGPEVTTLRPGDRVINQNHFSGRGVDDDGVLEGIPTNHASKEYQIHHEKKLARIPDAMPDEVAGGFSIGAQTVFSMVRKLDPRPGTRVLVTSAVSNTSLQAIAALRHRGVRVFASTTSRAFDDRLRALGVEHVLHTGGGEPFREDPAVDALAAETGGFDCVIDPYFDLHMEKAVAVLAPFGRYATCGLLAQSPAAAHAAGIRPINAEAVMLQVMTKNLTIIGNCIGLREDLEQALRDYEAGRMDAVVDSVFSGEHTAEFLDRTYNDRGRFGKVVFQY